MSASSTCIEHRQRPWSRSFPQTRNDSTCIAGLPALAQSAHTSLVYLGKLIWINPQHKFDWTNEVFKRAGTSTTLSVTIELNRGRLSKDDHALHYLVVTILQETWDRLERAEINISSERLGEEFYDAVWAQMKLPTPNLRTLTIRDSSNSTFNDPFPTNTPPLLQNLTIIPFHVSHRAWISHLTSLEITPESTNHILNAVAWFPSLKILRLGKNYETLSDKAEAVRAMSSTIIPRLVRISDLSLSYDVFNALWYARALSPAESHSDISIIMSRAVIAGQLQEIEQLKFLHALSNFFYHRSDLGQHPQAQRDNGSSIPAGDISATTLLLLQVLDLS
ncbi:hypothetical protein CPC08DRAFT_768247 [Agrocybe pediades]|nr:hypothetical protein CPC08DRAFT_768247 [Agrocybe pediades]